MTKNKVIDSNIFNIKSQL